jgi:mRNA interferase MazF
VERAEDAEEASRAQTVKRGDIFWAELRPRSGSEQRGRRPVVVMSNDGFNLTATWRSVIVVPVSTSEAQARRGPTAVALAAGAGGLPRAGIAVCHQVTTLDRAKLTERLGTLSATAIRAVESGLKAALDLE